jgi:GR25 family glycosyltransferase involved in LPS biosynthesis
MKTATPTTYWDFFDKIFCISLKERPDRRRSAEVQFEKVGLAHKVEFYTVNKHPTDPEAGIYQSHVDCLRKGLAADASHIAVFEDDIQFERFDPVVLKNCVNFLSSHKNWNILFLGCLVSGSQKTRHQSVLKIKYRCLAHAYVIHRKFAEALVLKPWQQTAFDIRLNSLQEDFYAVYPSFAFQSNAATDNDRYLRLDKIRRLWGGLRRIQKRNEFYHYYKPIIIAVHILILLLLFFWIL